MGIKIPLVAIPLIFCLFVIVPFWKIFSKAGLPRWLSLLMLVPFLNLLLFFYLAFSEWPIERELRTLRKEVDTH